MKKEEQLITKGFPAMAGQVVQMGHDVEAIIGSASPVPYFGIQALVSADVILTGSSSKLLPIAIGI